MEFDSVLVSSRIAQSSSWTNFVVEALNQICTIRKKKIEPL